MDALINSLTGDLSGQKIGCLGGGAMGEAILTGILRGGLATSENIFVSDAQPERLSSLVRTLGIQAVGDNNVLVRAVDILILAVKPQVIEPVLKEIGAAIQPSQLVISVIAGVSTNFIELHLGEGIPVVRVMPNTPCLVRAGASAVSPGKYAGPEHRDKAIVIFNTLGKTAVVPETLLDCVTGLSGSGPAYMYIILEALIDGAVRMGLPRDVATVLSAQTMLGAAKMVLETGKHPGQLKDMVTTPGGTTMAGLFALEEGCLRASLMNAVAAATRRAGELSGLK
ncbi:MAG: pyrroline-5-carboxylate reductase [Peptococcaceae bacterium]|jgi:pyrroline-5-carboxylate reductase|nr:MAG: pyrroline-5-carboxylate reductase [Peptococcaceae bacterium]